MKITSAEWLASVQQNVLRQSNRDLIVTQDIAGLVSAIDMAANTVAYALLRVAEAIEADKKGSD